MYDRITLGIRGDVNAIQKRLLNTTDNVLPVTLVNYDEKEKTTYLYLDFHNDLYILDRYLNVLAEYIIDRYEMRFIKRILSEEHSYLTGVQKRDLLKNIERYSDDPYIGFNARKYAIVLSIYDYLKEDSTMLLEGFVSFRLKEYESILEEIIERLIDNYITQKEYEEFIGLLKYFVNIQECRPELTHIIANPDGKYDIIDKNGRNITAKCLSDFINDEDTLVDINYDDLLISMLITLAPKKIVVHSANNIKNNELFNTVSKVFDQNMTYCSGCELCYNADTKSK